MGPSVKHFFYDSSNPELGSIWKCWGRCTTCFSDFFGPCIIVVYSPLSFPGPLVQLLPKDVGVEGLAERLDEVADDLGKVAKSVSLL